MTKIEEAQAELLRRRAQILAPQESSLAETKSIADVLPQRHRAEPTVAQEAERRKWDILRAFGEAEIPKEYRKFKMAQFPDIKPDWSKRGYCLRGPTGCRKSSLAGALVMDRITKMKKPHGRHIAWYSALSFCERIKSTTRYSAKETSYQIVTATRNKKLLVIDDLGRQRDHEWDKSALDALIWEAWDWGLDFIVTTQQKLSEVDQFDSALASRLGQLAEIDFGDKDWRMKRKNGGSE